MGAEENDKRLLARRVVQRGLSGLSQPTREELADMERKLLGAAPGRLGTRWAAPMVLAIAAALVVVIAIPQPSEPEFRLKGGFGQAESPVVAHAVSVSAVGDIAPLRAMEVSALPTTAAVQWIARNQGRACRGLIGWVHDGRVDVLEATLVPEANDREVAVGRTVELSQLGREGILFAAFWSTGREPPELTPAILENLATSGGGWVEEEAWVNLVRLRIER